MPFVNREKESLELFLSMLIIHLLVVVFKRLDSVEWPGLNPDCVLDNESLIYEYSFVHALLILRCL